MLKTLLIIKYSILTTSFKLNLFSNINRTEPYNPVSRQIKLNVMIYKFFPYLIFIVTVRFPSILLH